MARFQKLYFFDTLCALFLLLPQIDKHNQIYTQLTGKYTSQYIIKEMYPVALCRKGNEKSSSSVFRGNFAIDQGGLHVFQSGGANPT